jgi:hypothetical protein
MCGHRLSTAYTSSPSENRQSVCRSTRTTRRPVARSSESDAARARGPVATAVMALLLVDVTSG